MSVNSPSSLLDAIFAKNDLAGRPAQGYDSTLAQKKRIDDLYRGLEMVLQYHRAPVPVLLSFRRQLYLYLDVESELTFFSRAKYLLCFYMAWFLRNEPPAPPDQPWKHVGPWRRWAKSRRFYSRKNVHLWYSFLQAKRSASPASPGVVFATYEKHRKAMESVDPIDERLREDIMSLLLPVLEKLRTAVRKSKGLHDFSHAASEKACYEMSRSDGGAKGALVQTVEDLAGFEDFDLSARGGVTVDGSGGGKAEYFPIARVGSRIVRDVIVDQVYHESSQTTWRRVIDEEIDAMGDTTRLHCAVYGVLEPLKVRVITKGESIPYYFAKPLQKVLHSKMRKMPCFRLIGRPLCPTDLMDLMENPVECGEGNLEWNSVDYSAATDNLSASLSAEILGYIIQDLPDWMQKIYLLVLAPHRCEYPQVKVDGKKKTVPPVDQTNGQLMGSILSFPILCLANLGLYLRVIRKDTRSLDSKMQGVLVNGDDQIYRAPSSIFNKHIKYGKRVGLEMTPGKAYRHERFANANSTCFDFQEGSTPWQIDFLNTGLFFGQNKVLQKDTTLSEVQLTNKVPVINQLMKGALPGRRAKKELFMKYLALHRDDIRRECGWRNLFFHPSLGGMGVAPIPGVDPRSTLNQRLCAAKLADIEGAVRDEGVLPGPVIPEVSGKTVPWQDTVKLDFRIPVVRTRGLLKTLRDYRGGRDVKYTFPIVQCAVNECTRRVAIFEKKSVGEVQTPLPLPFKFCPVGDSYSELRTNYDRAAARWAESWSIL